MWDGVDRRKFVRAEYPCLITVRKNTPPPQSVLTHTEDIGVGGVRVIIRKQIEIMREVDLELDLKDTMPTVLSKGVIAWAKEIPLARKGESLHYDIGIRFLALKNEDRRRIETIVEHLLRRK